MNIYDITGWSGGGRRPLTYNLRAGQFRSPVRMFNQSFIINNYASNNWYDSYKYDDCCYDCCGGGGGGHNQKTSNTEKAMIGIGFIAQAIGTALDWFCGGKKETADGAGGVEDPAADTYAKAKVDAKTIAEMYEGQVENLEIEVLTDGSFVVTVNGKLPIKASTKDELIDKINAEITSPPPEEEADPDDGTTTVDDNTGRTDTSTAAGSTTNATKPSFITSFPTDINAQPVALSTLSANTEIDISAIIDLNKTTPDTEGILGNNVKITLTSDIIQKLNDNQEVDISGKFNNNKDVKLLAKDGYLLVKSGKQTYVLGKMTNSGNTVTYKGYQYEGSNTEGNGKPNLGGG